jgi:hypothetical protein
MSRMNRRGFFSALFGGIAAAIAAKLWAYPGGFFLGKEEIESMTAGMVDGVISPWIPSTEYREGDRVLCLDGITRVGKVDPETGILSFEPDGLGPAFVDN